MFPTRVHQFFFTGRIKIIVIHRVIIVALSGIRIVVKAAIVTLPSTDWTVQYIVPSQNLYKVLFLKYYVLRIQQREKVRV